MPRLRRVPVMAPIVPLHDELVRTRNEFETICMIEPESGQRAGMRLAPLATNLGIPGCFIYFQDTPLPGN